MTGPTHTSDRTSTIWQSRFRNRSANDRPAKLNRDFADGRVAMSTGPQTIELLYARRVSHSTYEASPENESGDLADMLDAITGGLPSFDGCLTIDGRLIKGVDEASRLSDWIQGFACRLRLLIVSRPIDEEALLTVLPAVDSIEFAINAHASGILEKIHVDAEAEEFLAKLPTTVQKATNLGIECVATVSLCMLNAPFLSDIIEYAASVGIESISVLPLDAELAHQHEYPSDHLSQRYLQWLQTTARRTAFARHMRFEWRIDEVQIHDFRREPFQQSSTGDIDARMNRQEWNQLLPTGCSIAASTLAIHQGGIISTCRFGRTPTLELGRLGLSSIGDSWNGKSNQTIRRRTYAGHLPGDCGDCPMHLDDASQEVPAFVPFLEASEGDRLNTFVHDAVAELEIVRPVESKRHRKPPVLEIVCPDAKVESIMFAISLGGQTDELHLRPIQPRFENDHVKFHLPIPIWESLRPNLAYWWMIWFLSDDKNQRTKRCREARWFIKHEGVVPNDEIRSTK